jgi:hypothetical protein
VSWQASQSDIRGEEIIELSEVFQEDKKFKAGGIHKAKHFSYKIERQLTS